MSDAVQIALIATIGPTLIGLFNAYNTLRNGKKLEVVHKTINSSATEQFRIGMISARTLAETTNKPEHLELARAAEEKYKQSVANQPT